MNRLIRLLAPLALLHVLACSGSVEKAAASGSGGTPGATTSSASTGTGGALSATASSASSSTGGAPVACELGGGAPAGEACAKEGEICDFAGSGCWVACTSGVWVEDCMKCPETQPENGTDCGAYHGVGPCSYTFDCGKTTATCDGPTTLWVVDLGDCGG